MKKLVLLITMPLILASCGNSEKNENIQKLIDTKNIAGLQKQKENLQAQIDQIDEALSTMGKKTEEALVATTTVTYGVFNHYIDIQGNVDTKENILIQPEMPGALVSLNARAGQRVAKGQVLGMVDDAGMKQQLAQVQTQYELAKTTYERQKRLWDQKIGSEIQLLQAQTQMKSLEKSISQIKAQINKTIIRAPFSGVIDEVFVEKGEVVAPNPQGLMRIVNLNNMYVTTSVPENYISKLKVGNKVAVEINSIDRAYDGKIRQVGNMINPSNRSFKIEVGIPNPENLLRPNQVAKLKIVDYVNPKAIVVPSNIIQSDADGNDFVFTSYTNKQNKNFAKKVFVTLGKSDKNNTEILSGLKPGQVVVTEGAEAISEGMILNY